MARREAVALYMQLIRVAKSWPMEPGRPERNLRERILRSVREQFKDHRGEKNVAEIQRLIASGRLELQALKDLKENTFAKMYPRTASWFPSITYKANKFLSQSGQEKARTSAFTRLFRWLTKRRTNSADTSSQRNIPSELGHRSNEKT